MIVSLEELLNLLFYVFNVVRGFEASHHISFTIHEEFSKVPLDVVALAPIGIGLVEHTFENGRQLVSGIETGETFLLLEEGVEGQFAFAVNLGLFELGEFHAKLHRAEFMNLLIRTGSLTAELIAGDVEDLESLSAMRLVERFEFFILRSETTLGSRVHNEENFALIVGKAYFVTFFIVELEIVYGSHSLSLFGKVTA